MSISTSISCHRISLWKRTTRHSAKRAGEEKESFPQSYRQAAVVRQAQMSRQATPAEDAPFRLSSKELDMMYVHKHSCPIKAVILAPEVLPKAPPPSCPHNPTDLFPNLSRSKLTGGTLSMKKQTSEQKWGAAKNKRRSEETVQPTGPYTNGRQDQLLDRPHGPTQSGIDSTKKAEKLRRFEHWK